MKIGFIGTGNMGSRMVIRLLAAGKKVAVYNRSPIRIENLVLLGAQPAESIYSIAINSDIICTSLSMPQDVLDVYLEHKGIIQNARQETICIDFTTVGVDTTTKVFNAAKSKGIHYLDAPVSGGPERADTGNLTIMVGGDENNFELVMPLLKLLGKRIEYLGNSGSGSIAKLINQYLVAVHSVAASEAMVVGTALGLNSEQLYETLKASYGYSRMLERHIEHYVFHRKFEPGGAAKYVYKDIKLANELFKKVGLKDFSGVFAEQAFALTVDQGLSDLDMSAVIQPLENEIKVIVKRT